MSVHVYPVSEQHLHDLEHEWCECEPRVEWIDEETGLPYPEGPLVIHERHETGEPQKKAIDKR